MSRSDEIENLREQERQLETLRLLVNPELWPRIYTMLGRVRRQIKDLESDRDEQIA